MTAQPESYATGTRRKSTNEASDSAIRKIWMIVELFRHKRLSYERYLAEHGRDRRSFQRDLQQLRKIGADAGFAISAITGGGYVELERFDAKIRALGREGNQAQALIAAVARAMGEPIAAEIGPVASAGAAADERFFHFAVPTIVESDGSAIAAISAELKAAWMSGALVTFRYPERGAAGGSRERLVEPHRVLLRSGVFYLVGFDRRRDAWRTFALDRFLTKPVRAGTNQVKREIPAAYASDDVLGFIKSDQPRTDVVVELSAYVAASAISRQWQANQQVTLLPDGRARIVFSVSDIAEVARWAFGFGIDATIVAPPAAVRIAHEIARAIVANHAVAGG